MKNIIKSSLLALVIIQSGCIKKESISDYLVRSDYWNLTNHCYEFGFLLFRSDGSGTLSVNDECVVGYPCFNLLPFNWSVDEKTGVVSVMYNNQSSAQLICSQGISSNSGIYPSTELITVSTSTSVIVLQGYTFQKD